MTDTIPYRKERLEYTIISSIIQGKPPADISELHTPELVAMILRGCWAAAPMARPTMPWCENVLIQEVGQHTVPSSWKSVQLGPNVYSVTQLLKERHGAKADDSTEMSFLTTSEVSGSHHQLPDKSATDLVSIHLNSDRPIILRLLLVSLDYGYYNFHRGPWPAIQCPSGR